jgi:hypothetical protein
MHVGTACAGPAQPQAPTTHVSGMLFAQLHSPEVTVPPVFVHKDAPASSHVPQSSVPPQPSS